MWLDDEGLLVPRPENGMATLLAKRAGGAHGQCCYGPVLLAGANDSTGEATDLPEQSPVYVALREIVREITENDPSNLNM